MASVGSGLGGVVVAVRLAVSVGLAGHGANVVNGGERLFANVAQVKVGNRRLGWVVVAVGSSAVTVTLAVVVGRSAVAEVHGAGLLGVVVHAVSTGDAVAVNSAPLADGGGDRGGEKEERGDFHFEGKEV